MGVADRSYMKKTSLVLLTIIGTTTSIYLFSLGFKTESKMQTLQPTESVAEQIVSTPSPIPIPTTEALKVAEFAFFNSNEQSRKEMANVVGINGTEENVLITEYALYLDQNPDQLSYLKKYNEQFNREQQDFTNNTDDLSQNIYNNERNNINENNDIYIKPNPSEDPAINVVGGNNGTSYRQYGNTLYGSDGSTYRQYGNTVYGNDGSTYRQYGDTTYGSDGSTYRQYGNTTYSDDGTTYRQYGNTIYGSDGSTARTYGNTTYTYP
jgi:hypothetical protein